MPVRMPAATGNFSPPPEGTFIGICYRVIDLGTQETTYKGQVSHKRLLQLSWELPDELMDDGRPYSVHKRYNFSSHAKSILRQDLQRWRGKDFTDAEIEGFVVSSLLGVGCTLIIKHEIKPGKVYANVDTVIPLPKQKDKDGIPRSVSIPGLINDPIAISLDDRPFDWAAFEKLRENLQDTIKKSPEYGRASAGRPAQDEPPLPGEDSYGGLPNDDIPF